MRLLSREYVAEMVAAQKPGRPAPWKVGEVSDETRAAVAEDMRATFAAMAKE